MMNRIVVNIQSALPCFFQLLSLQYMNEYGDQFWFQRDSMLKYDAVVHL